MFFVMMENKDISPVEIFFQGLKDHCKSSTPKVVFVDIEVEDHVDYYITKFFPYLMEARILGEIEKIRLTSKVIHKDPVHEFLKSLIKLQSLEISIDSHIISWEWILALRSFSKLKSLHIFNPVHIPIEHSPPPVDVCWFPPELKLDIKFPSRSMYKLCTPTDIFLESVLKSVLRSNVVTKMVLPSISRETMSGVHELLLHCPSLTTLELNRTRLGYEGILYICSALKRNAKLTHLLIHDDLLPMKSNTLSCFTSFEIVPLPERTSCTHFLLELNNILKENSTLMKINIQCGLFLPLFSAKGNKIITRRLAGLGPLQQFNFGAISAGTLCRLKRSFSLSDLKCPQTQIFWESDVNKMSMKEGVIQKEPAMLSFQALFSMRNRKKISPYPSFTAPDSAVLLSFSAIDPRLKECLKVSHLNHYVQNLRESYHLVMKRVSAVTSRYSRCLGF